MSKKKSARFRLGASAGLAAVSLVGSSLAFGTTQSTAVAASAPSISGGKIQHVVVLFDENISFDHYFGTYPYANNTDGVPFTAKAGTAGLPGSTQTITNYTSDPGLLAKTGSTVTNSPIPGANGTPGTNPNTVAPFRLGYGQAWTCSQGHGYAAEQKAINGSHADGTAGMDQFVQNTSSSATCASTAAAAPAGNLEFEHNGLSMSYTDGNTVTGLWNYAQNYAMSDNSWDANFGPSTVGATNVSSGSTAGAVLYYPVGTIIDTQAGSAGYGYPYNSADTDEAGDATTEVTSANYTQFLVKANDQTAATPAVSTGASTSVTGKQPNAAGTVDGLKWVDSSDHSLGIIGSITGDPTPAGDACPDASLAVQLQGQSVGDLMNSAGVSWGSFMGGFHDPSLASTTSAADSSSPICSYGSTRTTNPDGQPLMVANTAADYVSHHAPFQYYASSANPSHVAPAGGSEIGHAGTANHEYDLSWFYKAVANQDGATLPTVSYVRPIKAEDGHGGNSDPVDEQHFLIRSINAIEKSSYWPNTAIVIAYDDSDGFYDQVAPTILNGSTNNATSQETTICTSPSPAAATMSAGGWDDRCGPSQRLPLLVISPYAKTNYIDHDLSSQASVVKFIEDNFLGGARVDDGQTGNAATASFDSYTQYSDLSEMFNFSATPNLTPVLLNANGTVQQPAAAPKPAPKPTVTTPVKKVNTAALKAAKAKLAKDKLALTKAKKAAKKAKSKAAKKKANKKVTKLRKTIKADEAKIKKLE